MYRFFFNGLCNSGKLKIPILAAWRCNLQAQFSVLCKDYIFILSESCDGVGGIGPFVHTDHFVAITYLYCYIIEEYTTLLL